MSIRDVSDNMIHIINTATNYIWKLLRVDPEFSSQEKKNKSFFFSFFPIHMRWWMFNKILKYVSHIIIVHVKLI